MTKLTETPLTVFDVETTGLETSEVRIVEFGAAIYADAGAKVVRRRALINPGIPIPVEASNIHGITDDVVKDCEGFKVLWPRIHKHFEGRLACGYNVIHYDCKVVDAETKRHGLTHLGLDGPFLDLMVFVNWNLRHLRSRKLVNVAEHFGIRPVGGRAHSAAVDCQMTAEVLWVMIEKGLIPDDVDEAIEKQMHFKPIIDGEFERWGAMIYRDRETNRMRMGVGKNVGTLLEETPASWLGFALRKFDDMKPEVKLAFQRAKAGKFEDEFNEPLPGIDPQAVVKAQKTKKHEVDR